MSEITLREYIEQRIDWLRELMEERLQASSKALELQAKEYERRLQDLNHENARILVSQSTSVSSDKCNGDMKLLEQKIASLQESRNIKRGEEKHSSATWAYILAIGAMLIALGSLLVNIIK